MNRTLSFRALALACFLAPVSALAVDDIASECNDCHGDNGVSQWGDVPTIAGLDAFTSSEALYAYRDEARPCLESAWRKGDTSRPKTDMCAETADLTDDQVDALAEHYAALPFVAAKQDFDAALAEKGKALHAAGCERCHSDGGSNPDDEASILAGQHTAYLKQAIDEYRSGDREQLDKMKEALDALSDDDIKALLNYYASQQ